MTCAHVLGLIDAGPLADYPRAHLEAAWAHARVCATCGPALATAAALTAQLRALAGPATPDLSARVLARIEAAERERASMPLVDERIADARGWPAWATAFGGLTTAAGMIWSMVESAAAIPGLTPRAGGMLTLLAMPSTVTAACAIVYGLGLYLTGLFRPFVSPRA
jgi:hypothetical protein